MRSDTLKILVVDDNEQLCRAASRVLREALGCEVVTSTKILTPASVSDFDAAVIDWVPHGPFMQSACISTHVRYVIWTGDPEKAVSEHALHPEVSRHARPVVVQKSDIAYLPEYVMRRLSGFGTLAELMRAMRVGDMRTMGTDGKWRTDLPTFGGRPPTSVTDLLPHSWDRKHVLVGANAGDLRMVPREEWSNV